MIKINSRKELETHLAHEDSAYDVDAHFVMWDMNYQYPIWIEFLGHTHLGAAYKVRDRDEMLALKQLFMDL